MKDKISIWSIPLNPIGYVIRGGLVGILAGYVVSIFRLSIQQSINYVKIFFERTHEHPALFFYAIICIILATLFLSWLLRSEPNIKGSGIPQVKGQIQGVIELNWKSVLWKKFVGGILSIGSGAFLGREGPSIQLGATVGQGVNEYTHGNKTDEKILITSGASAGLSAAFNAPVAGLLFGLEEIHHHFSSTLLVTCFAASITSNFVSLNIFGMTPVLYLGELPTFPLQSYLWLIALGGLLAVFGYLYQKVLFHISEWYQHIRFLPNHMYGLIPFLLIIPIGYFVPDLLGGGAEVIIGLSHTYSSLGMLALILVLRFVFSMISYGSGLPGGIFLPLLTIGASLGALFGQLIHIYFGVDDELIRCFIVYAMAGYFTAICKAPLTGIILVSEMVGNLEVLMPIAIVSLSAYVFADMMGVIPVYDGLLQKLLGGQIGHKKGRYTTFVYPVAVTNTSLVGKRVKDCPWPSENLLVLIKRGEKEIVPHGDTVIYAGDLLFISADVGLESTYRKQLDGR
ncbi:ClC family H(+)/Cl(-) exchange transporter [Caldifermentibacillus hisashii]|uniref:ClC family H(+)/Cl(-) exchange transporter n=1 Tax=Caldifermentibacillus hisashii TaxID=996558 RepID=UPI0031B677A5